MPLFIYVDNIEKNIDYIKNKTNKKIMAVIKSDAYGIGALSIIKLLYEKVDYFVFEKYNEYLKCKERLLNKKVIILESINNYINDSNLRYSINSMIDVYNIRNISFPVNVHLRVDTGMNRLGFRNINEFNFAYNMLRKNKNINIEGIYTHFSSDAFESKYFEKQKNQFKKYLKNKKIAIIHANATRNINKEIIGNYIRIGIGMYGYHQPYFKLLRSVSLNAKVVNVFNISKNNKISYIQKSENKKLIGLINYGYNDVDLSKINYIYKNGQKYQLLGKSCMNHTHFYADDKINYLSWLSILPTNGIIVDSKDYNFNIDWYAVLTSLKGLPKNYIRRSNYDIPKIFKYNGKESFKCRFRKRSC